MLVGKRAHVYIWASILFFNDEQVSFIRYTNE